jgi:predicted nucleic acid-binding protein
MIYLDPSAIAKLLTPQPETTALRAFLAKHHDTRWFTCAITEVELIRAEPPERYEAIQQAIASLDTVIITDRLLESATPISPGATPLDALHLAAATTAGTRLQAFITYDPDRAAAAQSAGIPVTQPRETPQ